MREVWFIRHGESQTNAGLPSKDPGSTPLTPKGHEQSQLLAKNTSQKPDQIIHSKFIRTRQTANPTIEKFTDVPVDIWNVEEFTYLNPEKYKGTTIHERRPMAVSYWESCDPSYIDGGGAESFDQFIMRGRQTLDRLLHTSDDLTFVFSHGFFIKMICLLLDEPNLSSAKMMEHFYLKKIWRHPDNTEITKVGIKDGKFICDLSFLKTNPEDQAAHVD